MDQQITKWIDKTIYWSFCLIAFLVPIIFLNNIVLSFELPKSSLFRLLTIVIWIGLLIKLHIKKDISLSILSKFTRISLAGFVITTIIAAIHSISPHLSLFGSYERQQGLLQLFFYIGFFTAVITFFSTNKEKILPLIKIASYTAALISTIAILQKFFPQLTTAIWHTEDLLGRVQGTLGQPNFLGSYLVILVPFFIAQFSASKTNKHKLLQIILLTLVITAIILSGSRAAILAIVGELLIFSIWWNKKIFTGLAGIIIILSITLLPRFTFEDKNLRAVETRLITWQTAIHQIAEKPFLGYGPETFRESFKKFQPKEIFLYEKFETELDRAHNEILDTTAGIGLIGLFFYLIFYLNIIKTGLLNKKNILILSASSSLAGLFIANMFGFSTTIHYIFFWLIAGIIITITQKIKNFKIKINKTTTIILIATLIFLAYKTAIDPIIADYYYRQAINSSMEMRDFEAINYIQKAAKTNPYQTEYPIRGTIYSISSIKDFSPEEINKLFLEKAIWFFEKAKENLGENSSEILFTEALIKKSENKTEEAFSILETLELKFPNTPKYILEKALLLKTTGDQKSAIEKFEKYLSLAPYWQKAETLNSLTSYEYNQLRLFIKHNGKFPDYLKEIAELYQQIGDTKKSNYYSNIAKTLKETF